MKPEILFLDLDRTLFDTARFMQDMWRAIAKTYAVDYDHHMALVPRFYRAMGDYRYYDLKLHLQDGLGQDPQATIDAIAPILQKNDYAFPDVSELHTWQKHPDYTIRVLTFGPRWVQEFKLRFAPGISHLPCDIILEPKNQFIAREYAGRSGLLVDDKRNPNLPHGFREVWLRRDAPMPRAQEHGIVCINSLVQVRELL